MWAAYRGYFDIVEILLVHLSGADQQKIQNEIRKNWNNVISIRYEGKILIRDIRNLIFRQVVELIIQDYTDKLFERAMNLLLQVNKDDRNASELAAEENHPEIAEFLDPNNVDSLEIIRSMIEGIIRSVVEPFADAIMRTQPMDVGE